MEKTRAKAIQAALFLFQNTQTRATDGGSLELWVLVSAVLAPDSVESTLKSAITPTGLSIRSIILKIITDFYFFEIKAK